MKQIRKKASVEHDQFSLCPFGFKGGVVLSSPFLSMQFACIVGIICKLSWGAVQNSLWQKCIAGMGTSTGQQVTICFS